MKMATIFFWIGHLFEEFRSQVAIRKKKLISHPELQSFLLKGGQKKDKVHAKVWKGNLGSLSLDKWNK